MTRRRLPMNIDDPVEYLSHPAQVLRAFRKDGDEPKSSSAEKHPIEFYPAIDRQEDRP
jgi:hypothetical protein